MKTILRAAVFSVVTGVGAIAAMQTATAQVGFTLNFGDVAIAYRDGYYDSGHHWHAWRHADDYREYSRQHPDRYHDMRHDEDHGHH